MPSVYMVNMKRSLLLEHVDLKASTLYLKVCKKILPHHKQSLCMRTWGNRPLIFCLWPLQPVALG